MGWRRVWVRTPEEAAKLVPNGAARRTFPRKSEASFSFSFAFHRTKAACILASPCRWPLMPSKGTAAF